ncbi:G:T/U mismatch-specific DNA glycosylase [Nitrospira sp. KM1]|uniref:mismatch-specific DNA-glycosylase n=1 Tax=Nitrospira sp. KM1 TaxID=1936990 RepID=UPI0013A75DD0|nr:mismatch-specific DNA-glycosylase [Nitrospira sp. KM1]BCA55442.1 G:T/U mismatch-specific DNA glycosylase [Nitrospira sp. KM1]
MPSKVKWVGQYSKTTTKPPQHPIGRSLPIPKRVLPDYLTHGLRVLFVGINPGMRSASVGHHFAGYSNRFWKLLFDSALVPERLSYEDDRRLLEWQLGITNIIPRATSGIDGLSQHEYIIGTRRLHDVVGQYRPRLVALLGVTIYRSLFPDSSRRRFRLGYQPQTLGETPIFLLPNPSGRNAHYSYAVMLAAFQELRRAIDARD